MTLNYKQCKRPDLNKKKRLQALWLQVKIITVEQQHARGSLQRNNVGPWLPSLFFFFTNALPALPRDARELEPRLATTRGSRGQRDSESILEVGSNRWRHWLEQRQRAQGSRQPNVTRLDILLAPGFVKPL